ncbi:MAG: serine protease [Trueperaceae bacterium]|nr:serine protease [Trueperaceae bacterium]MCC6310096.1 serine protease [Trueperaceae bacterium]MCW5820372.1 serine protease [Trueperaceae bacterium]
MPPEEGREAQEQSVNQASAPDAEPVAGFAGQQEPAGEHALPTEHGFPNEPLLVLQPTQPRPGLGLRRVRAFTWLLLALLALTAVLGSQLRPEPRLAHVAGTPPAIEAPTGALLTAYENTRDATVRIEARCIANPRAVLGIGTGFFVTEDGILLTAHHVVSAASEGSCRAKLVAVTTDRLEFDVHVIGFDAYMDLAALQADVTTLVPYIPLATRLPSPGTGVVAIGNSRNDFMGARSGRVTRLGVRAGRADFADDTIELTNSLAPGDSGGPVVNARGEAVGVVSYISFNPSAMSSQGFVPPFLQGLAINRDFAGYAIPLTRTSELVEGVLAGGKRDVPVIGFSWAQGLDYDPRTSPHYLGARPGPIVSEVAPGGPAAKAGLRSLSQESVVAADGTVSVTPVADVIVAVDGTPTPTFADLLAVVRGKNIGDVVTLTVQRGNATFRVELTLGARTSVFAGN